jgi:sec-independent protein translocase protein TatA
MPGGIEWLIILAIGLLIFGKRLPEVGRSLGRGIVEFKKGVRGIEEELEEASREEKAKESPKLETPADDRRVSHGEMSDAKPASPSGGA